MTPVIVPWRGSLASYQIKLWIVVTPSQVYELDLENCPDSSAQQSIWGLKEGAPSKEEQVFRGGSPGDHPNYLFGLLYRFEEFALILKFSIDK